MTPEEALQETLAAEHATVYAYGVLGGRFPASDRPAGAALLRSAYDVHRGRRDRLRAQLADRGEQPVAPAAGYIVPAATRDPDTLLASAVEVEDRCAQVYAQMVAATTGRQRRWAVEALNDSAVRRLGLGGDIQSFPGAPELAQPQ